MKRVNRSAAAPVLILEMFSVMLLSALLVGMMMSESLAAVTVQRSCKPANKCGGCYINSRNECVGDCVTTNGCQDCVCGPRPNIVPVECWCQ